MKQKLSITIDEKKIMLLENLLKEDKFRSKSHIIEYVLNKFLGGDLSEENEKEINL